MSFKLLIVVLCMWARVQGHKEQDCIARNVYTATSLKSSPPYGLDVADKEFSHYNSLTFSPWYG